MILLFGVALAGEAPKNVVLADLGLHVIGIGYQRSLTGFIGLQVCAESYAPWTQNLNVFGLSPRQSPSDLSGAALRARVFLYPLARGPSGFWVSPFVQGGVGWASGGGDEVAFGPIWAGGVSAGHSWRVGPIHIALGAGLQVHTAAVGAIPEANFVRLYPTLDASLGYAW
jgi:hypothetical protein